MTSNPVVISLGLMVEVVDDRNRQMAIMYEMHAGADITDELTAKGLPGHIGINKTVECIASRYYWPDINGAVCKYINIHMPCMSDSQRESNKEEDFQDYDTSANTIESYVTNQHQLDDDGNIKGNDIHYICSGLFYKILQTRCPSKQRRIHCSHLDL